MAQTTKTYLELVNDTIDESGEELTLFREDGSDFATNSEAMKNRFKKWVKRAWLDIQEDANDWQWLNETAVVNITPGIMFYSPSPITAGTANINPAALIDVDDSTQVSGLNVSSVQVVSSQYPNEQFTGQRGHYLGYMDLLYDDYSYTNQHVLDFGLKAGGERLTREGNGRVSFIVTTSSSAAHTAAGFMDVGDVVSSVTITNNQTTVSNTYTLISGRIDSKEVTDEGFVTLKVSYASVFGSFFAKLIEHAEASVSEFDVSFSLDVATSEGSKTISGTIRFDDIGNQFVTTGSITPVDYKVDFSGFITAGNGVSIGDSLVDIRYSTTHLGDTISVNTASVMVVTDMFPSTTSGALSLSVIEDSGIGTQINADNSETTKCWSLWSALLCAAAPVCQANLPGILAYKDATAGVTIGLYNVATSTVLTTFSFTYQTPYNYINYVHSWKSYDWSEETATDDFVKSIRQIDQSTFRIINHEDPTPPGERALSYVPWGVFQSRYDYASAIPNRPRIITEDNMGRWRFYPPVDKPYTIEFNYIRGSQKLENANDVPRGMPDEYVDMIMWKALTYYGEYDEQPAVASRANKNYKNILLTIQQELRNPFYFRPAPLY